MASPIFDEQILTDAFINEYVEMGLKDNYTWLDVPTRTVSRETFKYRVKEFDKRFHRMQKNLGENEHVNVSGFHGSTKTGTLDRYSTGKQISQEEVMSVYDGNEAEARADANFEMARTINIENETQRIEKLRESASFDLTSTLSGTDTWTDANSTTADPYKSVRDLSRNDVFAYNYMLIPYHIAVYIVTTDAYKKNNNPNVRYALEMNTEDGATQLEVLLSAYFGMRVRVTNVNYNHADIDTATEDNKAITDTDNFVVLEQMNPSGTSGFMTRFVLNNGVYVNGIYADEGEYGRGSNVTQGPSYGTNMKVTHYMSYEVVNKAAARKITVR